MYNKERRSSGIVNILAPVPGAKLRTLDYLHPYLEIRVHTPRYCYIEWDTAFNLEIQVNNV